MTSRDIYTTVPEKGLGAVRRPFPRGALRTYFDSLHAAYQSVGLSPPCNGSHQNRPGFEDEDGLFQVAMVENSRTGYAVGRFVAASLTGLSVAESAIAAQNGE